MPRSVLVFAVVASLVIASSLRAQRVRFGMAGGKSLVGGGDSKVPVDAGNFMVTGAGDAGLHVRGWAEFPLNAGSVTFRTELFYNSLHSSPNTYFSFPDTLAYAALTDRAFGITGTFVASVKPGTGFSPYFVLGAGAVASMLGTNPDNTSSQVTQTHGAIGLGLQTGLGLRIPIQKRQLLLEWRYAQALNNTRGSAFMPLTIGITF
jgi:hypothetical protein